MPVACLPPIVPLNPKILILGSMPSEASLEAGQYYAHRRNHFWPLIASLIGVGVPRTYPARLAMLDRAGVAVWDVLATCERTGSLDQAIIRQSEQPNRIAELVADHPGIGAIALNGGRAHVCFRRHVFPVLPVEGCPNIMPLPSSSPANARMSLVQKDAAWSVLRPYMRDRV